MGYDAEGVKESWETGYGRLKRINKYWDKSLADLENLPDQDVLAEEIIENLEAERASFQQIVLSLNKRMDPPIINNEVKPQTTKAEPPAQQAAHGWDKLLFPGNGKQWQCWYLRPLI